MARRPLCDWPRDKIERVRKILNDNRKRWPEVAESACVGERYVRAFARRQIKNPPADRFMLLAQAVLDLKLREDPDLPQPRRGSPLRKARAAAP